MGWIGIWGATAGGSGTGFGGSVGLAAGCCSAGSGAGSAAFAADSAGGAATADGVAVVAPAGGLSGSYECPANHLTENRSATNDNRPNETTHFTGP